LPFSEAPVSVNFKPAEGFAAPLLTIRGENAFDIKANVEATAGSGLFEAIAQADAQFKTAYGNAPSTGAVNAQNILGATQVATAPAPAPAAAPVADGWAAQPTAAWGQQPAAAPAAQPQYAAPAPAAAPAANPAASAGAPFIPAFGQAAVFRSGQSARGPWSAYFDPRPKQVTDAIPVDHTGKQPSTDDVNHPGLAAGTHKFSKFIR
jgi:hypothetical protein